MKGNMPKKDDKKTKKAPAKKVTAKKAPAKKVTAKKAPAKEKITNKDKKALELVENINPEILEE